ncbi:bifunctional DNA primase/polymerase [Geochorda subterranea]|uniref:Bifunctional DNA primase/polymerase n=1 Tax=Geochorda subterranea TaxID=3109564 RepID=A0ABZ1BP66_9FIRM|nr:bifunctional DNA primase/polymerase [Limnochorda sp. LNt]WRP14592.1 bifunctional DNA primase/polymerase [Limnochorda sp. LNt]
MGIVAVRRASVNLSRWASVYAQRGFFLIPLCWPDEHGQCACGRGHTDRNIGKAPLTAQGVKNSSANADQVRAWWDRRRAANIGVDLEMSRLLVVDCDNEEAVREAESLGLDSAAPRVLTGGGGQHVYFRAPENPITASAIRHGKSSKIDVKTEGYTVLPPSLHRTGRRYRWRTKEDLLRFLRGDLPPAPEWAVRWLREAVLKRHGSPELLPPENVEALANKCLTKLPKVWRQRWAEIPDEDRSGWAFSLGCAAVEAGVTDPKGIAALVFTSAAHRDKFTNRADGWKDAMRIAERALQETAPESHAEQPATPSELPKIISARTLLGTPLPEPRWAFTGILPEGLNILAGKPKLGKSWLCLQLALAIGSGKDLGGFKVAEQGEALYLALEDNPRRLKSRILKLRGPGIEIIGGKIRLLNLEWDAPSTTYLALTWPRIGEGGVEELERWLDHHPRTRLVIIDVFDRFRPRLAKKDSANIYREDYASTEQLKQLASDRQIAILLVHHTRKADASDWLDEVSGSTGLTGSVDTTWVLKRARGKADAELLVTGRDVEEQAWALSVDRETGLWRILGKAEEFRRTKQEDEILAALRHGPATPAEIARRLSLSRTTVKVRLYRYAERGIVKSDANGRYYIADTGSRDE